MKPKPFASLNHFTVPSAIFVFFLRNQSERARTLCRVSLVVYAPPAPPDRGADRCVGSGTAALLPSSRRRSRALPARQALRQRDLQTRQPVLGAHHLQPIRRRQGGV